MAVCIFLTAYSIALLYMCIKDIDNVITAEEFLMHPNHYQIDTTDIGGFIFYSVKRDE